MNNPKKDVIKFAEEFAYGFDPYKQEYRVLELFEYQKKMLINFEKNDHIIIKQSRQVGIDMVAAIYTAYLLLKKVNKNVLVLSNKNDCAENFLERVKKIILYAGEIPVLNNKRNIKLKNGNRIYVSGASIDSCRGFSPDLIYINNFEFIEHSRSVCECALPAVLSTGGQFIISSMPKYKKEFFHELWINATKKGNGFKPINISWKQNPNFSEEWYLEQCLRLGYNSDSIATELDGKFIERKDKKKKVAVNIRITKEKKDKISARMKQKGISSMTDYIMELIDKDLS